MGAPLRITIDGTRPGGCESGVLVVTPVCEAAPCADAATVPWRLDAQRRAAVAVDAPAADQWNVAVQAERCWAPEVRVSSARAEQPVALALWRSAAVAGRLRFPDRTKSPRALPVRIESASDLPATHVQCSVDGDRFRCTVPAAVLDLRIAPEGWAPQYVWSVDARGDATADIGEVKFERGGAITGFVRFAGDAAALPGVAVELVPALPGSTSHREEGKRRTAARTEKVRPTARGFFQFRHLEPGPYSVVARADGWSPARMPEVRVEDGRETHLDKPLVIEPLARVEVFVLPPLDPGGQPWRVSLRRMIPLDGGSIPVAEGTASLNGHWVAEGVDAAAHMVKVADHRGNDFVRSVVEVSPRMAPVQLTITGIGIEGTVRLGDDPLETSLEFRHREKGRLVKFRSDAEGRFSGTLPEEGRWYVDVATGSKNMVRRTVEVRRGDGRPARIDLELPATSIDVAVVSESGKPVRAQVRALGGDGRVITTASTDEEGRVQLRGLDPEEDLRLSARSHSQGVESGAVPVAFDAGGHADVTIVMRPQIKVRGWLVTPSGRPVPGAFIRWVRAYGNSVLEEVSGPSGEFEIAVPHDIGTLEMVILPPAMPVKLLSIPVRAGMDPNLEIVVGGPSGTLELAMDHSPPFPKIRREGRPMSATWLGYPMNWTTPSHQWRPWGMVFTLEAGHYAVCSNDGSNCKAVNLPPGAVERIDGRELLQ